MGQNEETILPRQVVVWSETSDLLNMKPRTSCSLLALGLDIFPFFVSGEIWLKMDEKQIFCNCFVIL